MLGLLWGDGRSIWRAAKKAHTDKLKELLAAETQPNVVVNRKHPVRGITPLMAITKARNTTSVAECVRVLVAFGADVNIVDNTKEKNTALHYAAHNNKATAIGVMLGAGANLFARNRSGLTALDVAWMSGRREAARVLMKRIQLCSGWLEISGRVAVPRWKRQWCVVLACDSDCSSVVLCIFDEPEQGRPRRILHFGPNSTMVTPLWSPYEFQVDGVDVQQLLISELESSTSQKATEYCREFSFATDGWESANDRHAWVRVLRTSCSYTTGDQRIPRIKQRPLGESLQRTHCSGGFLANSKERAADTETNM